MSKISRLRVDRLLSNLGFATRSKVRHFLRRHNVTVDGDLVRETDIVNPLSVRIDGQPLEFIPPVHVMVHKPPDYVCAAKPDKTTGDSPLIYDLLPPQLTVLTPPLAVAGRLDKFATGLVILSQDGDFVQRVTSPNRKGALGKVYEMTVRHPYRGDEASVFASGQLRLEAETEPLRPAKFEVVDAANRLARITLHEGRYHQVVRMMAAMQNRVEKLHRVQVGPLKLGDLPEGSWRQLTEEECQAVLSMGNPPPDNPVEAPQTVDLD